MSTSDPHHHEHSHGGAAHPPHHHAHETPPLHDAVDEWHDHSHDEKPQKAHAEVGNAAMITGVGVFLFLTIVASCVIVYGFYTWFTTKQLNEQERATRGSPSLAARDTKLRSLAALDAYGWIEIPSTEAGQPPTLVVQMPLKTARERVIAAYKERK